MKYFVYVYLNPLKIGEFIYHDISFEFEPFYVGKGFGKRDFYHLNKVKNKNKYKKSEKFRIIEEILNNGLEPKIIRIFENCEEDKSLILERETITKIGRLDLKKGPLTNLNDGGLKPQDNYKHSKETKEKISTKSKNRISNFFTIISPDGNIFNNISLNQFCVENQLDYQKMRKFTNRGKIFIRQKSLAKTETINCEGWEVLNNKVNKKQPKRDVKYLLISPSGEEIRIFTYESAKKICLKLNLNLRILKLYRNKGKIKFRNKEQCKNRNSLNCQGWEFIDNNHAEHDFISKRKVSWKITSPNNEIYYESNLLKFCKDYHLSYRTFNTFKNKGIIDMTIRKNYKQEILNSIGWQCQELD